MPNPNDALALANLAVRVGLLNPEQVQFGWNELGQKGGEAMPFVQMMERQGFLTNYQSEKLLKGDQDGYFLGGYRLLYRIKSGTFGRVYRADNPRSGEAVAIKVLRRKWSEDPHNVELFQREGRLGMSLGHENIVKIMSVSHEKTSNQHYIVMEFVVGGDLRDMLKARTACKIEPKETLNILADVTAGLQFALSKGITHRDMKLTNILLSADKKAKLVDFGLAGAWGRLHANEASVVDRTVDYAGLERITNVPSGDTRSDIYFLGCVAYEILTGRSPLKATRNPRSRMQRERFTEIAPIQLAEVGERLSVKRLVEAMMSLDPQERFQTPSQLMAEIRKVLKHFEGSGGTAPAPTHQKTVFLISRTDELMNKVREKLKKENLRVFMATDPARALERFRQHPYELLVIDAGTVGEEGVSVFDRILSEACKREVRLDGILMLGEDQAPWKDRIPRRPNQAFLTEPITFKQLLQTMHDFEQANGELT